MLLEYEHIKGGTLRFFTVISVLFAMCVFAGEESGNEAMEIGSVITVDLGGAVNELNHPNLEMGTVELSGNMFLSGALSTFVTILSEGDMDAISVDQAFVAYESKGSDISGLIGLHTFNHGLLETHLISDPVIIDNVELKSPGITVTYNKGKTLFGLGMTVFSTEEILSLTGDDSVSAESYYAGILNSDFVLFDKSLLRISSQVSEEIVDIDLAASMKLGKIIFDMEAFIYLYSPNIDKCSGFYTGIAYNITDDFEIALRFDGSGENNFSSLDKRLGMGCTVGFLGDMFAAFEFSHVIPQTGDTTQRLAFQIGMDSSVKLPRFKK